MKGYKPQFDDHSHYYYDGQHIDADLLADCIAIDGHPHADEIRELMTATYRPEQLHNNGDIHDDWNPEAANLARVTHEHKAVNRADLAEQAGNDRVLWDSLAESYAAFVRYTERWRSGYNPDVIKPDQRFARRVAETRIRMLKSSKLRVKLRRRAVQLGIIK